METPQTTHNKILSETIMFLRFPLIVAVVFIHSNPHMITFNGNTPVDIDQFHVYERVHLLFNYTLTSIAVPLFFFISGFLFFYYCNFSANTYRHKLRKRVKTLIIPYIIWNLTVVTLYFLAQYFMPSFTSRLSKPVIAYTWLDWINIFWNNSDGMPVSYQLWFLRDLIMLSILSPIIYLIVRWCRIWAVIALGALWIFSQYFGPPGFSFVGLFFFTSGAWFGVNRHDFAAEFCSLRWPSLIICLISMGADYWMRYTDADAYTYHNLVIHRVSIIVGCITVISWTARGIMAGHLRLSAFLAGSSFFIFAYHIIPQQLIQKCLVWYFSPMNEATLIVSYFLIPFAVVGVGMGLYAFIRKYVPAFTSIITGGR